MTETFILGKQQLLMGRHENGPNQWSKGVLSQSLCLLLQQSDSTKASLVFLGVPSSFLAAHRPGLAAQCGIYEQVCIISDPFIN